jgi:hypothetical protein
MSVPISVESSVEATQNPDLTKTNDAVWNLTCKNLDLNVVRLFTHTWK